jgi:hypothetical protein
MTDELVTFLYQRISKESEKVRTQTSTTQEGFALEDSLALEIAQFCHDRKKGFITPYPARCELDAPTFSGQKHQFDLMVRIGTDNHIVAECKRRKGISTRDQILTFGAKVVDYGLGFYVHRCKSSIRGLFLSTADIPDGSIAYALGIGVEPVTPSCPPIEYMVTTSRNDPTVRQRLLEVKDEIVVSWPAIVGKERHDSRRILQFYKDHYSLWKEAMDSHG